MGSRGINRGMGLLLERRQERAFERVYRRHVADVYRYALVVLRDPQDAESVTQATFVSAYRRHRRGERPRKSHNWLLAIAHDVCRRRSEPTELDRPNELFADEEAPTPSDIRRALDSLGFDERAALMMREGECRSYAEIAELLDLSDSEVETLIFRARQALREQLEGSLSCHKAERAISRQLDGKLPRSERKLLRAHLEACVECGEFTEVQRRQRAAFRSFEQTSVPESLRAFRGGSVRVGPLARCAAVAAILLVAEGSNVSGVDPRQWGRDATRIQPADAAPSQVVRKKLAPRVAKLAREKTPSRQQPRR